MTGQQAHQDPGMPSGLARPARRALAAARLSFATKD
jgi:hypothetical protein